MHPNLIIFDLMIGVQVLRETGRSGLGDLARFIIMSGSTYASFIYEKQPEISTRAEEGVRGEEISLP